MKTTLTIVLKALSIVLLIYSTIYMLPGAFSYSLTNAHGLGATTGALVAYLLFASPGIYSLVVMLFPKRRVDREA